MHTTAFSGHCRYIVTDVDLTFLDSAKQLIPENVDAIRRAREAGVLFAFATGRNWPAMAEWFDSFGLQAPQILDNGATLYSPVSRSVLDFAPLDTAASRFLYNGLVAGGFVPILCTSNQYYTVASNDTVRYLLSIHNEYSVDLPSHQELLDTYDTQTVKIGCYSEGRVAELETLTAKLAEQARTLGYHFTVTFPEHGILVITGDNINKMTGIGMACKILNCTPADIAAIGDGNNDADMLAGCGLGFAVANATPAAIAAASHTVADNDHAGFAQAIQTILDNYL